MSIEEIPQGADIQVISKNEKKAREAIKKFGLKQIKGISRVTFKQKGNLIHAIETPEVYKSANGTYIVFGEAKIEDLNQRYAAEAAAAAAAEEGHDHDHDHDHEGHDHSHEDKSPESITADLEKASITPKIEEEEEEGEVDESGLDPKDIDIIIEQTKVSRAKAVKALRKHDGDMVNAIMEFA